MFASCAAPQPVTEACTILSTSVLAYLLPGSTVEGSGLPKSVSPSSTAPATPVWPICDVLGLLAVLEGGCGGGFLLPLVFVCDFCPKGRPLMPLEVIGLPGGLPPLLRPFGFGLGLGLVVWGIYMLQSKS